MIEEYVKCPNSIAQALLFLFQAKPSHQKPCHGEPLEDTRDLVHRMLKSRYQGQEYAFAWVYVRTKAPSDSNSTYHNPISKTCPFIFPTPKAEASDPCVWMASVCKNAQKLLICGGISKRGNTGMTKTHPFPSPSNKKKSNQCLVPNAVTDDLYTTPASFCSIMRCTNKVYSAHQCLMQGGCNLGG